MLRDSLVVGSFPSTDRIHQGRAAQLGEALDSCEARTALAERVLEELFRHQQFGGKGIGLSLVLVVGNESASGVVPVSAVGEDSICMPVQKKVAELVADSEIFKALVRNGGRIP